MFKSKTIISLEKLTKIDKALNLRTPLKYEAIRMQRYVCADSLKFISNSLKVYYRK